VAWYLVSAAGHVSGPYASAQAFCTALREALSAVTVMPQLEALWQHNAQTIRRIRLQSPDLKSPQGTPYAELLERLYQRNVQRLTEFGNGSGETNRVDKSELAHGEPKRLRDTPHRQFVASQPCIVCGRAPSHPHHLRFAQPRAMASKVSDEWLVPLCFLHHRALHDAGDEEKWWEERQINAKAEAERLWRLTRGTSLETAPTVNNDTA
jgi:hypothetical protein